MVLQLHISATQQKAPLHDMHQNGSKSSQRAPNVSPSPTISRLADKLQSKVCSIPAKELQVLGKDGPFHRERTQPLGTTEVPYPAKTLISAASLIITAPSTSMSHCNAASLIS